MGFKRLIIPMVGARSSTELEMKLTSRLLLPTAESPISKILNERSQLLLLCPEEPISDHSLSLPLPLWGDDGCFCSLNCQSLSLSLSKKKRERNVYKGGEREGKVVMAMERINAAISFFWSGKAKEGRR